MKRLIIALIALGTTCPAFAEAQMRTVEITAYGIYTAHTQSSKRDRQGIKQNISTGFQRAATTTTIPAQLGVRFGFEYKVVGAPAGEIVSLKKVTIVPPAGLRSPVVAQPVKRQEDMVTSKIGDPSYTGYRFDDPWELVPGPWRIELWDGDRKLAEQTFTVVAP
jgi:Domain of unknown function (DUF3859)